MRRPPPEIDRLMWALSENPNPQAMDEFGVRYPEWRSELLHRVGMVRGLRQSGTAKSAPKGAIPKFQLREPPRAIPARPLTFFGAVALCALAAASYVAVSNGSAQPPKQPLVPPVDLEPLKQQTVVKSNGSPTPPPQQNDQQAAPPRSTAEQPPMYLKPRDLEVKGATIRDALHLITNGTGIHLVIGPGFADQVVTLDYRNKNTLEMLMDMADRYAFTVSDEGDGTYLVIPVADTGSPAIVQPNLRRAAP